MAKGGFVSFCVVFVTAPRGRESDKIAQVLLKKKLCACVNIVRVLDSFFWWQDKIDSGKESLLVIKTKRVLLPALIKAVREAHRYSVPEIIALPIVFGNKDYLKWITASCRKG